jgi:VanZ family protein
MAASPRRRRWWSAAADHVSEPKGAEPASFAFHALYGLLTLASLLAIYWLSSQSHLGVSGRGVASRFMSKLAHVLLYAGLAFCLVRALTGGRRHSRLPWAVSALAVLVAGGFGALDEWHQSFVRGRSASLGDVILDLTGASAMVLGLRFTAARTTAREGRPERRAAAPETTEDGRVVQNDP